MDKRHSQTIKAYLDGQVIKVVQTYDFENKKVKYADGIKRFREITKISGDEEIVRAYLVAKLVNELGYAPEFIELEKQYDIGRPKPTKPRIDVIVRDKKGDAFLFIELKSPHDYERDKDEVIEKQLFNLASQETGRGKSVKYLVLYTFELAHNKINDKCMVIDYEKSPSFDDWRETRDIADALPARYGKAQKEPYIKGGEKDLETDFTHEQLDRLGRNLHNRLWGGGGTDDNDIFSSLVNLILAKIQDEAEKKPNQKYDFQTFSFQDGESVESNEKLFDRINALYRRALKQKFNIVDEARLAKSFVVEENKFQLYKLRYTVAELEKFSFVDGKNSLNGKDILGDFFEGIIREGFKQTKGQFFTHINIVKFLLWGLQLDKLAIESVNERREIPYMIDPSAGSGTFLMEYMKFITENLKRKFKHKLDDTRDIRDKRSEWFEPANRENRWAGDYIYGVDINFNLGTAAKVNMLLHGDGATNIFIQDGLLPFKSYDAKMEGRFDVIVTNPPFSVDLDNETKKDLQQEFIFGGKKNSENLFVERWQQLLKPGGRLGAVLPESVFDTTENKYIRLFIYKHFRVKAVVSLPTLAFEPFTSTKTSLLLAQKKTDEEVKEWDRLWSEYSAEWSRLQTRCRNLMDVHLGSKDRAKLPSVKNLSEQEEKAILARMFKNYFEPEDANLSCKAIITKYRNELEVLCKYDNDTRDAFGFVNTRWVFGEVAKELRYNVLMAEVENIGYKRTKRGERSVANDLFRSNAQGEILVDDGVQETALDHLRKVEW